MSVDTVTTAPSAADVRAWAREQGLSVGTRGRISEEILTAYAEAHEA